MASSKGVFGSDETFPSVDVNGELYPGATKNFPVDPISSDIYNSKQLKEGKEQAEAEEKKRKEMKKKKWEHGDDGHKKLKSTVLISGVVVAVIGALFALTKKMREKPANSY
ncbi:hypothetical protein AQUCO_07200110v1 [Aquilegia coerulea]|uniref:Uncharacterized protein n=1 Tax=Aquilegia coerulea TaxID=218851 RepID=A0A2G5CAC7_AQUCA|nr:hypothetical protein AQUCO_07200110v1 [Aquilegia coerulea]